MIPRINLYQQAFQPVRDWLNARHMLVYYLLFFLLLVIGSGISKMKQVGHMKEMDALQAGLNQMQSEVEQLKLNRQAPKKEDVLEKRIEDLARQLQSKEFAFAFLTGRQQGNREGFSPYFQQLAEAVYPDLWVTQISLDQAGKDVAISGRSLRSDAVFTLIGALRESEKFKMVPFPFFQLTILEEDDKSKQPSTLYRFNLASSHAVLTKAVERDDVALGSKNVNVVKEGERVPSQNDKLNEALQKMLSGGGGGLIKP
ncbi:MAG: PilN domain-containing protein [Magnetococcales bacterium]|nr:PilN domain-containing protein [Magnetococcales bacterium]